MSELERELNWDDIIEKDGEDLEPLPEGDYDFVVESFERGRSKGEGKLPPCNMAILKIRIQGKERNIQITENLVLHTKMEWKLSQFFRSIGAKEEGQRVAMNWSIVPGASGRALVKQKPGLKDPAKMYNYIDKFYPKEAKKFEAGRF
ncbi:MAG: hypothetical protein J6B85_05915 [Lachnospiraceae bacterium]|nr:hypothetical protein [Lachnospiraceae bacterium]